MPYTTNKIMPRIRREAARLVYRGWSARKVGRYLGYHHTAVMDWVRKAKILGDHPIPTQSSRPRSHPKQLKEEVVNKIVKKRREHNRYAEAVHKELLNDGVKVSLSSVKRTLERKYLIKKRSPWKRYHPPVDRPYPLKAGDLVEIDTIHRMIDRKRRLYVFVLIDVFSRWVYARAYERMNAVTAVKFATLAQKSAPFQFNMLQSDHGPEFGKRFKLKRCGFLCESCKLHCGDRIHSFVRSGIYPSGKHINEHEYIQPSLSVDHPVNGVNFDQIARFQGIRTIDRRMIPFPRTSLLD